MRRIFEARASTILFRLGAATPDEAGVFLLPANVCPVVPLALLAAGRRFDFIDLDPETLCMSETLLKKRLEARGGPTVAGVVFVRTYGAEVDAERLFLTLRDIAPRLLIIDDRCCGRPLVEESEIDRQGADVVLFSTGYGKFVDLGFGGFAYLGESVAYSERHREYRSVDLKRVTELYKDHISARRPLYRDNEPERVQRGLGDVFWLQTDRPEMTWDDYCDAVLQKREECDEHRAKINAVYRSHISTLAQLPSGYHLWRFQIKSAGRDTLLEKIFAAGFFASDHYFPAAVLFGGHACPVATNLHDDIVNLFNDPRVSESDAEKIGGIVARHLTERRIDS